MAWGGVSVAIVSRCLLIENERKLKSILFFFGETIFYSFFVRRCIQIKRTGNILLMRKNFILLHSINTSLIPSMKIDLQKGNKVLSVNFAPRFQLDPSSIHMVIL